MTRPDPTDQSFLALLAQPETWSDPPDGTEDAVVAAITGEVAAGRRSAAPATPRRRYATWLAAAAIVTVIAAGAVLLNRGDDADGVVVALAATEAAPGASARAQVSSTPAGLKILLDVDGLPGAPEGAYYEAWVSDGTTRVSAGTFHLRRGDGEIELWAGVAEPGFDRLAVTLEPLDDELDSSGDVLLSGEFRLDG